MPACSAEMGTVRRLLLGDMHCTEPATSGEKQGGPCSEMRVEGSRACSVHGFGGHGDYVGLGLGAMRKH